ncbi:MAG: restriction endonuclease subunit S [Paludibacteraceae bacterium]|nr:restriction endonuclease subunit S [Paludibacteraceae bacterium]
MMLDTTNWKKFRLGDLFRFEVGKISNKGEQLSDGTDCLYLGASKQNNSVQEKCFKDEKKLQKGNCILFICDGQGSVGYTNYINEDFIATTNIVAGYNSNLNPYVGLFLVTVFDLERLKYSYGRKWYKHLKNTVVKLPCKIDCSPDWQFMEDYIKQIVNEVKEKFRTSV